MTTQRKQYSAEFKARVAMEALEGHKTMNELVSMYGVHPTQITKWKNRLFSRDHESSEQFVWLNRRSSEMETQLTPLGTALSIIADSSPDEAV